MKAENRIPTMILTGYAVALVIVVWLGVVAVNSLTRMNSIANQIYAYPFMVSHAAQDMRATLFRIHNDLLQYVLIRNNRAGAARLILGMQDLDKQAEADLAIVKADYRGDKNQIDELERLLAEWKVTRIQIMNMESSGRQVQAENIVRTTGTSRFNEILRPLDYVISFARAQATYFVGEANLEFTQWLFRLKMFFGGLIAVILATMLGVILRIRRMLGASSQVMSELRESERRFREILDNAPVSTCIASMPDGRIIQANQVFCNMFGYAPAEMHDLTVNDITYPDDRARTYEYQNRMQRGEIRFVRTGKRFLRKDGQPILADASISIYADDRGNQFTIAQIEDVSERIRFDERLKENEEKFQILFESASDCMVILSMSGRILDINRVGHEQLGYAKEEMLGRPMADFDSPEFSELVPERVASILRDGQATFDSAHQHRNGTIIPVEVNARAVRIGGEQMVFGVIRNAGERKAAERALRDSEAQYHAVIETSADGFWIVDTEARLLEVNDAYVQLSGYSRDELLRMRVPELEAVERSEETISHVQKILREGNDRFETFHRAKDGRLFPVEIVASFWPALGGRLFVFIIDIAKRKAAIEHSNLLAKVFENSSEAMLITDADNNITEVNRAFSRLTGYSRDEVLGRNPRILASGMQSHEFYREMWHHLLTVGHWEGEVVDKRKDGSTYPKWLHINLVRNDKGAIVNHIASFTDITERKRTENEIRQLAYYDTLTGLHNRFSLIAQLEQQLSRALRNRSMVAVMFIDLDRFKVINDTLGHHVGDGLLIEVAGRLRTAIRGSDLVARLGGDEFVVLLEGMRHADEAALVAHKIIERVSQPYDIDGNRLYTSPSIGISIYPEDAIEVGSLMQNADMAMYHSKTRGGSNYSFFDEDMNNQAAERLNIENSLREAIARGELELHYQPQVNLKGEVVAVEALLRWRHPARGLVMPDSFIPIAEDTGLILAMGHWVLESACSQLRKWMELGLPLQRVAINVSVQEFFQESFDQYLRQIVDDAGIRPDQVELEITESAAMENSEQVISVMRELKASGFRLAIDDFGTGYSSLSYLRLFPIDQLKIDQSFIRDLEVDSADLAITVATINLSQKLGIEVAAEGVETKSQSDILASYGCNLRQGYLFSKPLPPHELEKILLKQLIME